MRRLVVLALVALGAPCAVLPAGAAPAVPEAPQALTAPLAAKLDAFVTRRRVGGRGAAPAIAVAIVENGKIVYEHADGIADVAAHRAANRQTPFRVGSVTKMFTAVAVLQLVERGKIALDEPLATYLPDAPHAREVTIRQLLMHATGIADYLGAALESDRANQPASPRELVASVAAEPLAFAPGTRYAYSNTNYVLLGMAVESVTRTSLAAYEREHLFAPAGMMQTTLGVAAPGTALATGYHDGGEGWQPVKPYDPSWLYACGDGVSTASDLARFDIALMNGVLLQPQTVALMSAHPIATGEEDGAYGLGVSIVPFAELTFVGHHGGVPGFASDNELLPARRFATVVLGNASDFVTARINGPILAQLLPATSARALTAHRAVRRTPAPGEDVALTARFRAFFEGLREGKINRDELTDAMNAQLTATALPELAAQLAPLGTLRSLVYLGKTEQPLGTAFRYTGIFASGDLPLTFSLDKDGKIAGVVTR